MDGNLESTLSLGAAFIAELYIVSVVVIVVVVVVVLWAFLEAQSSEVQSPRSQS